MRWLAFSIFHEATEKDRLRFAIRESQAVELLPFSGVVLVPGSPDALIGSMNWHEKPTWVYDLGAALGMGPGYLPKHARLLVARQTRSSRTLAIAVQPELPEVANLDLGNLQVVDLKMLNKLAALKRP
ncbi:MAG: chemotaxis protein CheW [Acidobacteria bacterium]|nr:chemotaxis protein CheW [Acidobacteriota bacterium]